MFLVFAVHLYFGELQQNNGVGGGVGDIPGETEEFLNTDMNVVLFFFFFPSFRFEGIP